jgi:light-regulated signal transduction histidine kinase (bacteriophytochrome)
VVGVEEIVRKVIDEIWDQFEGGNVEFIVGPLPTCDSDFGLTGGALINLIDNAIKYSRARDSSGIQLGYRDTSARPACFVRDNAVSFGMCNAGKLFGAFQRLPDAKEFEGIGVGLVIVHCIVSHHGGIIEAGTQVDRQAAVSFTFGTARPPT